VRPAALLAACAIAVVTAAGAGSATSATTYSRLAASASFVLVIDYGSHPESTFNGRYTYTVSWRLRTIVAFDGKRLSVHEGKMLVDGTVSLKHDLTEWRGPDTRRAIRCRTPGSKLGRGQEYLRETKVARFSGGGGVGAASNGLTVNPGRVIDWSIECSATESLETHDLQGGPGFRVKAPARSLFRGTRPFGLGCRQVFEHDWEPASDVPGAHRFTGITVFAAKFTPFPVGQLDATEQRLRDAAGDPITTGTGVPIRDC
jgi:hypothetical protein